MQKLTNHMGCVNENGVIGQGHQELMDPIYRFIIRRFRIIDILKVDPKSVVSKQNCIDHVEK